MDKRIAALWQSQRQAARGAAHEATPDDERRARAAIIREARAAGAVLTDPHQRGGLPASLVLGVFRRDSFQCKACSGRGAERGGLGVHHKGGGLKAPASEWLRRKGKSNDPNNIVTVCAGCHSAIHDKDRALAAASPLLEELPPAEG